MSKSAQKDWSPERRALEELSAEWREQLLRHPRLLPHDGVPRAETHEADIRQKYVIACLERMGLPAAAERVRKCTAQQFCFCSGVKFVRRIILYFDPVNEIWDADAQWKARTKESDALGEQTGERGSNADRKLSFQKMRR